MNYSTIIKDMTHKSEQKNDGFTTIYSENATTYSIAYSAIVQIRIYEKYIDILSFKYDMDMIYPYFDEEEETFYMTMSYSDARQLINFLGYELYHDDNLMICLYGPFEIKEINVNACKREIWVNPKNNPFENTPAEEYLKF